MESVNNEGQLYTLLWKLLNISKSPFIVCKRKTYIVTWHREIYLVYNQLINVSCNQYCMISSFSVMHTKSFLNPQITKTFLYSLLVILFLHLILNQLGFFHVWERIPQVCGTDIMFSYVFCLCVLFCLWYWYNVFLCVLSVSSLPFLE